MKLMIRRRVRLVFQYKVKYSFIPSDVLIPCREVDFQIYDAFSCRDAVSQCRADFSEENELIILSVAKWSTQGYWMPQFDSAWR